MKNWESVPDLKNKSVDSQNLRFCFKDRDKNANKGTFGTLLCVCGTYPESGEGLAMSGAATLCARAAYRSGSGLVKVFTHKENYTCVSAGVPEAVMLLYGEQLDNELLAVEIKKADAVVVGCGLGKSEMSKKIFEIVLKNASSPMLIDADGLNLLSENPRFWEYISCEQRKQTVVTPHPMEMSRLCGLDVSEITKNPAKIASDFSKQHGIITLLKGHNTVISNGETAYINQTGNPGMAKAGSGDVLSGVIGSMLANKTLYAKSILQRVALGAYLHGAAGDLACDKLCEHSLLASDIVESIPEVLRKL